MTTLRDKKIFESLDCPKSSLLEVQVLRVFDFSKLKSNVNEISNSLIRPKIE